jgi:thiamine biosynthesis lipoprotein ApbE
VLSTTAFILGIKEGVDYIQGFPGAEGLIISTQARAQTRGFFKYEVAA